MRVKILQNVSLNFFPQQIYVVNDAESDFEKKCYV